MPKVRVILDETEEPSDKSIMDKFFNIMTDKRMENLVNHSYGDPLVHWINLKEIQKAWPF